MFPFMQEVWFACKNDYYLAGNLAEEIEEWLKSCLSMGNLIWLIREWNEIYRMNFTGEKRDKFYNRWHLVPKPRSIALVANKQPPGECRAKSNVPSSRPFPI